MEWSIVGIEEGLRKLWGSEAARQLAAKGKCLLELKSWRRDKRLFDGGVGVLPRVLEAYMGEGEEVWPHPPEAERQGLHGYWPIVRA